MRKIHTKKITSAVRELCLEANYRLRKDTLLAYRKALEEEESPVGQEVLRQLLENAEVAREQKVPFCQDTGYAVLFLEVGQKVCVYGGSLSEALNEGVRQAYRQGYLRKSLVCSPIQRINTGDNTPAVISTEIVDGDSLKIALLVKGGGCDNVSRLRMFTPAEGLEKAKRFIVETVERAGPNASPPMVIGVGIGGPFAQAALLAQKALLWPVGKRNPDTELAELEMDLMQKINDLGIGPGGYGGRTTILGIHVEVSASHMASFPVAVNIDCHSHRGAEVTL